MWMPWPIFAGGPYWYLLPLLYVTYLIELYLFIFSEVNIKLLNLNVTKESLFFQFLIRTK